MHVIVFDKVAECRDFSYTLLKKGSIADAFSKILKILGKTCRKHMLESIFSRVTNDNRRARIA